MPHYAAFFDSSATALQKDTRHERGDSIFQRTNPANTSEVVYSVELGLAADVDRAVAAANASRRVWASKTAPQRNQVLRACVEAVVAQKERIAHVIMKETGRPFPFCIMEVMFLGFARSSIRRGLPLEPVSSFHAHGHRCQCRCQLLCYDVHWLHEMMVF